MSAHSTEKLFISSTLDFTDSIMKTHNEMIKIISFMPGTILIA